MKNEEKLSANGEKHRKAGKVHVKLAAGIRWISTKLVSGAPLLVHRVT